MHPEEVALLDDVHAAPKDDAPRLIYADWLTDQGHADLAEFIRLQCYEPYFPLGMFGTRARGAGHGADRAEREDHARVGRAAELLGRLYGTARVPAMAAYTSETFVRGLPRYAKFLEDCDLGTDHATIAELRSPRGSALARVSLSLHTARIQDWLLQPVMRYVDVLHVVKRPDGKGQERADFTRGDVRALAAAPLLDRLENLVLVGGCDGCLGLAADLLGPRVTVDFVS
jgi:uncharacterized protein (TIGR02996 family)